MAMIEQHLNEFLSIRSLTIEINRPPLVPFQTNFLGTPMPPTHATKTFESLLFAGKSSLNQRITERLHHFHTPREAAEGKTLHHVSEMVLATNEAFVRHGGMHGTDDSQR